MLSLLFCLLSSFVGMAAACAYQFGIDVQINETQLYLLTSMRFYDFPSGPFGSSLMTLFCCDTRREATCNAVTGDIESYAFDLEYASLGRFNDTPQFGVRSLLNVSFSGTFVDELRLDSRILGPPLRSVSILNSRFSGDRACVCV